LTELNGHSNGTAILTRHGSYHVRKPKKNNPETGQIPRSLRNIFRKQKSLGTSENTLQTLNTSRKDSDLSPTMVDRKSEGNVRLQIMNDLENSFSNCSSVVEHDLPNNEEQVNKEVSPCIECEHLKFDNLETIEVKDERSPKAFVKNGKIDKKMKTRSLSCEDDGIRHDKKQNGYGLKVYCVKTNL